MKVFKLSTMKDGWFLGNFSPTVYQTAAFEVAVKTHKAGEHWPAHYQRQAVEYTVVLHGKMTLNGTMVRPGDIIRVEPEEVIQPVFYTDVEVVVIKVPSLPGDKVVVEPKSLMT